MFSPVDDEVCCVFERAVPRVVRECPPDPCGHPGRAHRVQLVLEEVPLVEEDDEGHEAEVDAVGHRGEEAEALAHAVGAPVLRQHLVELGEGDDEEDGGDVVEAVDPLLAL